MRILITGARGMLGTDLIARLSRKNDVIGLNIKDLDITDDRGTAEEIKKISPELVINAAAFADVDACETEKDRAFKVNRDGTRHIALGCRDTGAKLIYISTDYVFDGNKRIPYTEEDETCPINIYGQSKLEGEKEILRLKAQDSGLEALIVRTSWLFGRNGKNFVDTILNLSRNKNELKIVEDQIGSPTYTIDLSDAIEKLIDVGAMGIVHCSNEGECSWYDFAKEIIRKMGIKNVNVVPIVTGELKRPAPRPAYSVMNKERYYSLTGHRLRKWEDGLDDYLSKCVDVTHG